ncbi:hypothetical protein EYC84_011442 [Monilinia fructicola]|uniref:2-hydroxyacyl-CoA lyase n=1 Tax=Monilinia fructicola TaxID=38448 RepID=A0A5M9J6W3_MONFR|nr:hypothetical protein EYC84_011442 [Monilinia fructicola]
MASYNGAQLVARSLKDLGVEVIFGLVAASYAATAYGYLTGRPGVCLVVGGPGVLHAMAGSSETHLVTKGAFQELDAISLLHPHTKIAVRSTLDSISHSIRTAYRTSWYGRPGTGFIDLPADVIQGEGEYTPTQIVTSAPRPAGDPVIIQKVVQLIKSAKAPLVIVGKGAAYAQAESIIRQLINQTNIPFLPTPMGKGVLPDSHSSNTATSRSAALKGADMILVLGARLNWILHYGEAPKYNENVKIIQVDTSAEEIGKNNGDAELGIIASASKNEATAAKSAKVDKVPMTYGKVFDVIKETIHKLSPPKEGGIVYVSEGANTMDISRSAFPVEHPRLRLDAGTHATMGVGLGYAIAAHCYLFRRRFCFRVLSAEVETMARYGMDILIFVINNGGVYQGDSESSDAWLKLQKKSEAGSRGGLRSTSLGWEVGYEKVAEMCGGKGYLVHTPDELAIATEEGFKASVPVIVNVIIEAGAQKTLEFAWQQDSKRSSNKAKFKGTSVDTFEKSFLFCRLLTIQDANPGS